MGEPQSVQLDHTRLAVFQVAVRFGDQDLTVAVESAVIVEKFADLFPDRHRPQRERNFRHVPRQHPHPTCIHARRMAARVILFEQGDRRPCATQVKRCGAAVNATPDDQDVPPDHQRTTAFTASCSIGKSANSLSMRGFTGARRR